MELLPQESLYWLLLEPNWKAFAGLTFLLLVTVGQVYMLLRKMNASINLLASLPAEVADLKEQMYHLTQVPGSVSATTADGTPREGPGASPSAMASIANQLDCVDAKLLDLGKLAQSLQLEIKHGTVKSQVEELLVMVQTSQMHLTNLDSPMKDSAEKLRDLHEQFKRGHVVDIMKMLASKVEASELEAMNTSLQQVLLDIVKKLALKVETTELSELNRLEKQALMEKIVKVETTGDKVQDLCKTLSNEIHVCKTVVAQKVDALQKDMTSHMGWSTQNLRPLFPCVPMIKTIETQLKDAIDYLARNYKNMEQVTTAGEQTIEAVTMVRQAVNTQMEFSENQDQRIGRVESIASGTLDVLNETQDQVAAMAREHAAMLQQVLERLPKLPLRKPPPADTQAPSQPASSSTPAPDGPQPQAMPSPMPPPMQSPPVHQSTMQMNQQPPSFELRLNDHMPLQVNPRRQAPQIFMITEQQSSQPVLREVTQQDVFRALFPQP
ncbi:Lrrc4c [Symbiodinium sp. CCMP2592]|nr:Lrrc4c [Symbiodinium sp. CCMP2592]